MQKLSLISSILVTFLFSIAAHAHHSFAVYDLENKTELKGVLSDVSVRSPHIIFSLEAKDEQGNTVQWRIESMNPNRWRSFDFPEADTIAKVGDEITILGWKARNGDAEMALGSIITLEGETEIRDRIRQGQGGGMAMGGGMAGGMASAE